MSDPNPVNEKNYLLTQQLLAQAGTWNKLLQANRDQEFNVFSVLRADHDEVNLHSAFIASLLDFRYCNETHSSNLEDFLDAVVVARNFSLAETRIDREFHNIDILIRDKSSKRAVVLENKIWAEDQPCQLYRYFKTLKEQGYKCIHLVYLTLDGREPSEESAKGLDVCSISYGDNLIPWLQRCQQRAHSLPELRESISQYVKLVNKLLGRDMENSYKDQLKELLHANDNLLLVHDLNAISKAVISDLLGSLFDDIDRELRHQGLGLPDKHADSSSSAAIGSFIEKQPSFGSVSLEYDLESLGLDRHLTFACDPWLWFGIPLLKSDDPATWEQIREVWKSLGPPWKSSEWTPCFSYSPEPVNPRDPTRDQLKTLHSRDNRSLLAEQIVSQVKHLIDSLSEKGLIELPKES